MVRGRKPLATATKEANGSFVNHPERRPKNEPKLPANKPKTTKALRENKLAHAKWKQVVAVLEEMGILTVAEADLIESYAFNYASIVVNRKLVKEEGEIVPGARGGMVRNPRVVVLSTQLDRQLKMLVEMGLTPSARTRVQAAPEEEEDIFASLIKQRECLN